MTQPKRTTTPHARGAEAARRRGMIRASIRRSDTLDVQDIGQIPTVANPARRQATEASFRAYCETYYPERFYRPWSPAHLAAIAKIEEAVKSGGWFAFAMPREWGKTTLCEAAAEWAAMTGRHQFVLLIRATAEYATQSLGNLKTHLTSNEMLAADYPEIVYPVRKLEGESRRCLGQRYRGRRTLIGWTQNQVILPTIPGSPAGGTLFRVAGITGNIRGAKHDRPDGLTVRPSLAVVDDPQTDESAKSPLQVAERLKTLTKAIQRLGDSRLSILLPCTVIEPGDMADQVLDRAKFPEYRGERTRMLVEFPRDLAAWKRYREMQTTALGTGGDTAAATEFYRANREAMDAGAVIAWPEKFDPPREISAVQHAMNRFLSDPRAFWCEDQNDPATWAASQAAGALLTPGDVAARLNGLPRGTVPLLAQHLTAGIDVHDETLYWTVTAWAPDFTGWVVDYGAWPEQGRAYWSHENPPVPLSSKYAGLGTEAVIRQALLDLVDRLCSREFPSQTGAPMRLARCLIDLGYRPDQVCDVCRASPHAAVLVPSRGVGITCTRRPMSEYAVKPGARAGWHWYLSPTLRHLRSLMVDSNHWKSFLQARWRTPIGDPGCLSLPGREAAEHEFIAAHATSELPTRVTANGRTVEQWAPRPGPDMAHWLDCLVMTAAAASLCGASLPGSAEGAPKTRRRYSMAEMQAARRR